MWGTYPANGGTPNRTIPCQANSNYATIGGNYIESIIFNGKEFKVYPRNHAYYVSKDGEVYSTFSKKIIKPLIRTQSKKYNNRSGKYYYVDVNIEGKQRHMPIHKMVYETWYGLVPEGKQVNHKNDKQFDNNIANLYAGTQKENINDCVQNGHRVGNVCCLTVFDKETNTTLTFCPANKFIKYCGHPNSSRSLNKFFSKQWFKDRYEILEFKHVENIEEFEGVTTMADECKPVE